ncbi:MAG TPA: lytic transglycosylase domain-containing protein [Fimbriimonadales bacterium]|nr:lytic transglycosylase domain-containing protein [Fimbriimonadales bacterium]
MAKGPLILVFLGCWLASGSASELSEYLKIRKKYGISQPTTSAALQTLVGYGVFEVKALVKGTLRTDEITKLLLEGAGGSSIAVSSLESGKWLEVPNTRARIIFLAKRENETAPLTAEIISAIPEDQIAYWEAEQARKAQSKARAKQTEVTRGKHPAVLRVPSGWSEAAVKAVPLYAKFIRGWNPRLDEKKAWEIAVGIIGFSLQYGIDARLITAMVLVESGFNPSATSRKGAMGLGQLMPGTAKGMGVRNAYDTYENLWGTVRLIRGHLEKYKIVTPGGQKYGDLVLALAAYNAGGGAVRKYGGVPPYRETQGYIQKVIAWYKRLSGN